MGVDLKELIETDEKTTDGDPIFSHMIKGDSAESAQAKITAAIVNGTPLTALCGYTWIPSRNPENHPVCPKCEEIYEFDRQFPS